MTPTAVALLVIIWPGHDIPPQSLSDADCRTAAQAITLADHIRDEKYSTQAGVRAYCIPLGTPADDTVQALLSPPEPAVKQQAMPVQKAP